jgi:hypothetical protein
VTETFSFRQRLTRGPAGPKSARTLKTACDHGPMSDADPERSSFEDVARALADEVSRAIERLSEIDVDEIARAASAEAERARRWIDDLGRWLREQGDAIGNAPFGSGEASAHGRAPADRSAQGRPTGEDPLRHAGPHPLDLPTADQGLALAALDSGRWRVEPGTSALAVHGEGPGPSDALGLVREMRVRDWMTADGEITLAGRDALRRWLDAADRS